MSGPTLAELIADVHVENCRCDYDAARIDPQCVALGGSLNAALTTCAVVDRRMVEWAIAALEAPQPSGVSIGDIAKNLRAALAAHEAEAGPRHCPVRPLRADTQPAQPDVVERDYLQEMVSAIRLHVHRLHSSSPNDAMGFCQKKVCASVNRYLDHLEGV